MLIKIEYFFLQLYDIGQLNYQDQNEGRQLGWHKQNSVREITLLVNSCVQVYVNRFLKVWKEAYKK